MKKYKLIKRYPNNNNIGLIIKKNDSLSGGYSWKDEGPYDSRLFSESTVEGYPEFWEEIIEPNYLITAFRNTKGEILKIGKSGHFYYDNLGTTVPGIWLETCLKAKHNEIYSVKNSKGEEFTIEDSIKVLSVNKEIIKFELLHGFLYCHTKDYLIEINNLEKSLTPIFISADGKEIFEGDKYYVPQINGLFKLDGTYLGITAHDYCKAGPTKFSTAELAQEYIDNNKPKYSLKDIRDAGINTTYFAEVLSNLSKLDK